MWNGGHANDVDDYDDRARLSAMSGFASAAAAAAASAYGNSSHMAPSYLQHPQAARQHPRSHHPNHHSSHHHHRDSGEYGGHMGRASNDWSSTRWREESQQHQRSMHDSNDMDERHGYSSSKAERSRPSHHADQHPDDSDDSDDASAQDSDEDNRAAGSHMDSDAEDENAAESADDDESSPSGGNAPRGKPEAMAARLASASRVQEKLYELESERDDGEVVAEPVEEVVGDAVDDGASATEATTPVAIVAETPTSQPKKKKRKSSTPKKPRASSSATPSVDDPVPPITDAEYENVDALMVQFCRVPLLAEFSRPVALLHPELMSVYSKIVDSPVDLGKVCRGIRRRQYENLRAIRLDTWRIFANCVKYHSHPNNKEAVPSFVSIALHLRDYFNALWQEHMIPSAAPATSNGKSPRGYDAQIRAAISKRAEDRKRRLVVSGLTVMTGKCVERAADALEKFIVNGGCVDRLDEGPVFGPDVDDDEDLDVVVENLKALLRRLRDGVSSNEDYGVDEFHNDVKRCYTEDVLENNPSLRTQIGHRLDRFIGKIVVPIHEASCRGVTQSSIWGCMAAAVWARESSKKPFWPALVLGIMAPEDQREDWHIALTERNEARLPNKLRAQLSSGKRKAEQALKRQSMGQLEPQSFFLVEFLGTHEFIWVKESDIVENFDPNDDPNQQMPAGSKKKRSSRSNAANVVGSKIYASAVEEGKWALEEFELQLQDTCGDPTEEEDDGEEMNYSYSVLCQSDDEADDELGDGASGKGPTDLDIEECNELLATEGLLDFSATGRKNAKKRAQALKRQKQEAEKKEKADKAKKVKAEQSKKKKDARSKERESKKEQRDLEKRRKKRGRERDRALKGGAQKAKKQRVSSQGIDELKKSPSGRRNLIADKRGRATAIVQGYLNRVASNNNDFKSLALGGVMTIPVSLVDSSGLLGMALAFRAAAGELAMPDESGDQETNLKAWDAIDVDSAKTAEARVACLEKQAKLLEKEIDRVKQSTTRRRELAKEAAAVRKEIDAQIAHEDNIARQNPFKKKKPPEKKKKRRTTDKAAIDSIDNDDVASSQEAEVAADQATFSESQEDDAAASQGRDDDTSPNGDSVADAMSENTGGDGLDDSIDGRDDNAADTTMEADEESL